MVVTYAIELKLVLEEDDSPEAFRHDVEKAVKAEWVKEPGELVKVKTARIE